MRSFRRLVSLTLALVMALVLVTSVFAADYTYKVTISGGKYGKVDGAESVTVDMAYGTMWNPDDYTLTVTDAKYYFKGFHISGQEGLVGATKITQDMVFVATYGVAGDSIEYTVNYHDVDGKELAKSQKFYGNVGDKPVVAFRYIEGYEPQAYNLTGTLKANAAENIFTFEYREITAGTGGTTTVIINEGGGAGGAGGGAGGAGGAGGGNAGGGAAGGNEGNQGGGGGQTGPVDIIDIDNPTTPLAPGGNGGNSSGGSDSSGGSSGNGNGNGQKSGNGLLIGGLGAVAAAGIIAGIAVVLARRKKKDKYE